MKSFPSDVGFEYESVFLKTEDNVRINGWWVGAKNERAVILFFHGNAGNISHRLEHIKIFNRLNLSVFIIDYRGYGQSEGTPSEKGTYLDAQAAFEYLTRERKISPGKIVVYGHSLGGAIGAWLAKEKNPAAAIIDSTFLSLKEIAKEYGMYYPFGMIILSYKYDNLSNIKKNPLPCFNNTQRR